MTDDVEALIERFVNKIDADEILSPSQARKEALTIQEYCETADQSSLIEVLYKLLKLWSGYHSKVLAGDVARYTAWIHSSDQDRKYFTTTFMILFSKICSRYEVRQVGIDADAGMTVVVDFMEMANIVKCCRLIKRKFNEAMGAIFQNVGIYCPALHTQLMNFLFSISSIVFETMEMIVSHVSLRGMQDVLLSKGEKVDLTRYALDFYHSALLLRGEVKEFLILPEVSLKEQWLALYFKVTFTSNLDYLIWKATNVTCSCGRFVNLGSEFAILNNCYDLLCVQCAKKIWQLWKCPVCGVQTDNWLSSDLFLKMKSSTKKRKCEFPDDSYRRRD